MTRKMTPDIYVHKKLGFGHPADDPEVQSIVDEMHADFDAAVEAFKVLQTINRNTPEMVIADPNHVVLTKDKALAADFEIFSEDESVAKAASVKYTKEKKITID